MISGELSGYRFNSLNCSSNSGAWSSDISPLSSSERWSLYNSNEEEDESGGTECDDCTITVGIIRLLLLWGSTSSFSAGGMIDGEEWDEYMFLLLYCINGVVTVGIPGWLSWEDSTNNGGFLVINDEWCGVNGGGNDGCMSCAMGSNGEPTDDDIILENDSDSAGSDIECCKPYFDDNRVLQGG